MCGRELFFLSFYANFPPPIKSKKKHGKSQRDEKPFQNEC